MSNSIYFRDSGWDVLSSAWTAASKNGKETDIRYTWGADGFSFLDSATGTAQVVIPLPFRTFLNYMADCQKSGVIADLSDSNLPSIVQKHGQQASPWAKPGASPG